MRLNVINLNFKTMAFTEVDLQYKYSWEHTKKDDPKLRGEPDSSLLNRSEGYEVLYMIQRLMAAWNLKNVASGKKIEKMIREACPSNLHSQAHVKQWIDTNWDKY